MGISHWIFFYDDKSINVDNQKTSVRLMNRNEMENPYFVSLKLFRFQHNKKALSI